MHDKVGQKYDLIRTFLQSLKTIAQLNKEGADKYARLYAYNMPQLPLVACFLESIVLKIEPSILICDDSIEEIRVLVSMLRYAKYRIIIATNGRDACSRASLLRPDLILLDLRMPVVDGFATCRILKAHEDTKDIPVIFLTAANEVCDRLEGLKCGAVDYVVKPANEEEVLLRVAAHLRLKNPEKFIKAVAVPKDTAAIVQACIRLMETDLSWTPSVEELCAKVGTNRFQIIAAFREVCGATFYEWLRDRRMQQACDWLEQTNISISTIAYDLGYTTSGNFATAFKERFDMSPRVFRQQKHAQMSQQRAVKSAESA